MLKAGMHFGHQTSKWHPKMEPFIFTTRNGVHIIDLVKSRKMLEDALEMIKKLHSEKKIILYSSKVLHNIFHKANELIDKRIHKKSGDLEVFRSAIQELSRQCFVWPDVVSYAFARTRAQLPTTMDEHEFLKILTAAVKARHPWSRDDLMRKLGVAASVAQFILQLLQLFRLSSM